MRRLASYRSLAPHLARLGMVGIAPALLLVLSNGALHLLHPAEPRQHPPVSTGSVQSEPVKPLILEEDLRKMPSGKLWQPGDPVRVVPRRLPQQPGLPPKTLQPPLTTPRQLPPWQRQAPAAQEVGVFPSIRYAGRLASDPLGTLPQGEAVVIDGAFTQMGTPRWGDYSSMNVDPADDCTFWYTQEYVATDDPTPFGTGTWGTRIASFRFPSCAGGDFSTPVLNFEGLAFTGAFPPDTVGDVGPHHYIQMVNDGFGVGSVFAIYDKTGNLLAGPISLESLWTAGGPCASGSGDPIVLYDRPANRWLLSEFAFTVSEFAFTENHLCIYISRTPDPVSGGWFLYDFPTPEFPDYPKYAVWRDAYYVSTSESNPAVYALDRTRMLNGQPATFQRFTVPPLDAFSFQALTPSDLDGSRRPPAGSPNYFMRHRDDEAHTPGANDPTRDFLEMWEFRVDFANPANSTLTGPIDIPVAEFDSELCGFSSLFCFPQPDTTTQLDPLREVIMWRLQYRNFGSHETLVGNFVTDVDDTNHGGIRWFELRKTAGTPWTLFQEGTHAPDPAHRWMGSIAMDKDGNMALGYSVSAGEPIPPDPNEPNRGFFAQPLEKVQ